MELASQECCLHRVLFTRRYVTFVLVIITFVFTYSGMRFFRNFLDLRSHSRGNPRSGLIFMGGVPYIVCAR